MGDVPSDQAKLVRGAADENIPESEQQHGSTISQQASDTNMPVSVQPATSTHPVHQTQRSEYYPGHHGFVTQNRNVIRPPKMGMGDIGSTLPGYQTHTFPFDQRPMYQHFVPAAQSQGILYSLQPMSPFAAQPSGGNGAYGIPFSPVYPTYAQQQHHSAHIPHGGPAYQPYVQNPSTHQGPAVAGQTPVFGPAYYYQQPYTATLGHGQALPDIHIHAQPGLEIYSTHNPRNHVSTGSRKEGEQRPSADYDVSKSIVDGSAPMKSARAQSWSQDTASPRHSNAAGPSTPRGPPRKPKQSGHALWVGNLPPSATVVDLRDHFSRDATNDIESVFLISKSNCAFVNYKTDAACTAALARFHDSRFQGVRLVCRLRRGLTTPGSSTSPFGGAAARPARAENPSRIPTGVEETHGLQGTQVTDDTRIDSSRTRDRYFVVKSLTVEDLEMSRQSGIWATQTHNEAHLNQAYETTDNVYLIFSANKSGEYFGYARMISRISEDEGLALEMPPRPEHIVTDSDELDVTPAEASSTAPKGRIIDDSARGSIFWEADSSDDGNHEAKSEQSLDDTGEETLGSGSQAFGKPFRIEWLSTERVPFYRTRGLRNSWNANREVKIARDGTEIEPTVGRILIQLFHTQPSGHATQPLQGYQPSQSLS